MQRILCHLKFKKLKASAIEETLFEHKVVPREQKCLLELFVFKMKALHLQQMLRGGANEETFEKKIEETLTLKVPEYFRACVSVQHVLETLKLRL